MILQETVKNLNQEIKELLENPWFWIGIIILLIFVHILITMALYPYISNKIHNSYHKGYNKAKSDKVQYYKTIRIITDSFDTIFNELTKEGSGYMYKASTLELILNFRKSLDDYYNN